MKPFRLQPVLNYRKHLENKIHSTLLQYHEERKQLERKKTACQNELEILCSKLREAKCNCIRIPEIILYENCIGFKKCETKDISHQLETMDQKIKQEREKLVQARQEKRALEILKENREKEEKANHQRMENIFIDEISILCFGDRR